MRVQYYCTHAELRRWIMEQWDFRLIWTVVSGARRKIYDLLKECPQYQVYLCQRWVKIGFYIIILLLPRFSLLATTKQHIIFLNSLCVICHQKTGLSYLFQLVNEKTVHRSPHQAQNVGTNMEVIVLQQRISGIMRVSSRQNSSRAWVQLGHVPDVRRQAGGTLDSNHFSQRSVSTLIFLLIVD